MSREWEYIGWMLCLFPLLILAYFEALYFGHILAVFLIYVGARCHEYSVWKSTR